MHLNAGYLPSTQY